MPTEVSVVAGTFVMFFVTEVGRLPEPRFLAGFCRLLMTMKPTTITSTSPTEPATMRSLRRCSAFLAAACCAAIRSRALRVLLRVALLI